MGPNVLKELNRPAVSGRGAAVFTDHRSLMHDSSSVWTTLLLNLGNII